MARVRDRGERRPDVLPLEGAPPALGLAEAGGLKIFDVSEGALLVEYPDFSEEEANRAAVALGDTLGSRPPAGLLAAIPGARTLLVEFDPRRVSRASLASALRAEEGAAGRASRQRFLRIPVSYDTDPDIGPDLTDLAGKAGLPAEEFARRHAAGDYRVAFLGFAPGFAYLTGLPRPLRAPRLPTPRTRVPAGSVGIAAGYTGIYPGSTPGGWRLVGRAPVRLFDARRDPPSLFLPGDLVRFEPIAREEFERRLELLESEDSEECSPASGSLFCRVAAPGAFTSIQGAPHRGWEIYGVPPGGAMDPGVLARGNGAVGNPAFEPGLEMTLVGPELEILAETDIALAGADFECTLNGRAVGEGSALHVRAGDALKVGRLRGSARGYLSVAGGVSQSDRPRPTRRLAAGDMVFAGARAASADREDAAPIAPSFSSEAVVRVLPGPQQRRFEPAGLTTFLSSPYRVSASSDRRGIRLEGPAIENRESADIPPEGTTLGGIQVPRDGQPIVLGPDRPVTGGYARIATVIAADFPLLARALPGSVLRFRQVTLAEALEASSPGSRVLSPG